MKATVLVLAGSLAVGLCGCATDEPLFANDYTKGKTSASSSSKNADVVRDLANKQLSEAPQGQLLPRNPNSGALQQGNPYN
jgi:hypothetical protein